MNSKQSVMIGKWVVIGLCRLLFQIANMSINRSIIRRNWSRWPFKISFSCFRLFVQGAILGKLDARNYTYDFRLATELAGSKSAGRRKKTLIYKRTATKRSDNHRTSDSTADKTIEQRFLADQWNVGNGRSRRGSNVLDAIKIRPFFWVWYRFSICWCQF